MAIPDSLERSPPARRQGASSRAAPPRRSAERWARTAPIVNSVARISFRPATLATASTCTGITAKRRPAAVAPTSGTPSRRASQVTSAAARAFRRTFTRWYPTGSSPPAAWFSAYVRVVKGRHMGTSFPSPEPSHDAVVKMRGAEVSDRTKALSTISGPSSRTNPWPIVPAWRAAAMAATPRAASQFRLRSARATIRGYPNAPGEASPFTGRQRRASGFAPQRSAQRPGRRRGRPGSVRRIRSRRPFVPADRSASPC